MSLVSGTSNEFSWLESSDLAAKERWSGDLLLVGSDVGAKSWEAVDVLEAKEKSENLEIREDRDDRWESERAAAGKR
jgi:hypothetical protein